jgi:peptidoglycan/LPS O-acetylase OafA/YrhL
MAARPNPSNPVDSSQELTTFLDLARWVAAALVLVFHVRNDLFAHWTELPHHGPWEAIVWVASSLGHAAVMVFFVLSGYLVGGAVQRDSKAGRLDLRIYAIHRFARLYAVLPAALLLGLVLDGVGSRLFDYGPLTRHWGDSQSMSEHLTLRVFVINLCNCQTILGPTFGSNGALWSLAPEFWYYVLFPALVVALDRRLRRISRLFGLAVCIASSLFIGANILAYFALWLTGALVWRARGALFRSVPWALFLLLAVMAATVPFNVIYVPTRPAAMLPFLNFGADALVALSFANLLATVARRGASRTARPLARWIVSSTKTLSGFTYTLYLTHPPFLAFVAAAFRSAKGVREPFLRPDAAGMAIGLGVAVVACGYAYIVASFTERRTRALRVWLRASLLRNDRAPMSAGE